MLILSNIVLDHASEWCAFFSIANINPNERFTFNVGTTIGAKRFTVAFLNNFQYVAEKVGRMPRPELCAFLKREGVTQNKAAKFRPVKVDAAIDFLLANNVVYAEAWKNRKRLRFSRRGIREYSCRQRR